MTQTIVHILLLIISGVTVFTMVIPTFQEIGDTQRETEEYQAAYESAFATNEKLNSLVRSIESMSQQERYHMEQFLPDTIDAIKTAYDLEVLIEKSGLFLVGISVGDETSMADPVVTSPARGGDFGSERTQAAKLAYRDYTLGIAGTYDQFKLFLADLESSLQLFEVVTVSFSATDSDINQYQIVIRTYGLNTHEDLVLNQ